MTADDLAREHAANTANTPPTVQALRQSLTALIEESQALRGDVHTAEAARRRANHINFGVLGVLVIFVMMLMGLVYQNNQLSTQVADTNKRMADCTTPGGTCYAEGNERTGRAINDIVRASVFMSQCARLWPGESGPEYDKKLETCVAQRLAANDGAPPTAPGPVVPSSPPASPGG